MSECPIAAYVCLEGPVKISTHDINEQVLRFSSFVSTIILKHAD